MFLHAFFLFHARHFAYVHRVLGVELARIDHFARVPSVVRQKWLYSPSDVLHFPQHSFETLLATLGQGNILRGWEVDDVVDSSQPGTKSVTIKSVSTADVRQIDAKYVVAADGANSGIRTNAGIPMCGSQNLQSLINVHFSSPELATKLASRPAMLYFVYNQDVICVLVTQNPMKGEYVCQIPFFYPHETVEEYPAERCLRLIRHAIGDARLQLDILSIKPWTMHAQVAERWVDLDHNNNLILAGDAAHRFPPAGGFGMNTGIQDAHDLAWRLAGILRGDLDPSSLNAYSFERRAIAQQNTELSLVNYEKTAHLASLLGVDPDLGKKILQLTSSVVPKAFQKTAIQGILNTGRAPLATLSSSSNLYGRQRVASFQRRIAEGGDLALLFPLQDVGYRYPQRRGGPPHVRTALPEWLLPGRRVPHAWMALEDRLLVSTAHVPSILSALRNTPTFVVLSHPSSKDGWQSVLRGRSNWAVVTVADATDGGSGEAVKFDELQKTVVRPLLLDDDDSNNNKRQASSKLAEKYQLWADLHAEQRKAELAKLVPDDNSEGSALRNLDGQWFKNLDGQWFKHLCVGQDGKTLFDVILRPDGHLADVCDVHATDSQRQQLLGNLTVD